MQEITQFLKRKIAIFFTIYKTIKNENTGIVDSLGLGLPIVKYLVEKQNGVLEIKSEKNKDTEIRIIL